VVSEKKATSEPETMAEPYKSRINSKRAKKTEGSGAAKSGRK
jgi:hypothetical protein